MKLVQYGRAGVRKRIGFDDAPTTHVFPHVDRPRIDLEIWASCDSKRTLVRCEMTTEEARVLARQLEEAADRGAS